MHVEQFPRIGHRIEPLWDTRNEAVTTYVCLPEAEPRAGLSRAPSAERSGLAAAAARIGDVLDAGERFLVCLPVSYGTMEASPGRAQFLAACRALPVGYRQYLVFILTGIPIDVTRAGLVDAAAALRPFGRTIAALTQGCRDLAPYMSHAVSGLALDFGEGFADDERTRAIIGCAGEAARDLRWGAMALNLENPRLLAAVGTADFRFLHGGIVMAQAPAMVHPAAVQGALGTSPYTRTARI